MEYGDEACASFRWKSRSKIERKRREVAAECVSRTAAAKTGSWKGVRTLNCEETFRNHTLCIRCTGCLLIIILEGKRFCLGSLVMIRCCETARRAQFFKSR